MEPKLARQIKIEQKYCHQQYPYCSSAVLASKAVLLHACDKFSDNIKYMDLVFLEDELVPALYKILLRSNQCPNLKGIRIGETSEYDDDCRPLTSTTTTLDSDVEPLPTRTKLVYIYLKVPQLSTTTSLGTLGQLLIDSTPNLQRLELSSHVYFPDLSKCSKLVSLLVPRGPDLYLVKFESLSRMLKQVADRLEVLIIGCRDSLFPKTMFDELPEEAKDLDFEMPKMMPRIRILRNEFIEIVKFGDALEDICGKRCPSLRHLTLGSYVCTDDLLKRMGENGTNFAFGKGGGVMSLSLENVRDPPIYLKTSFPHLKRLEIFSDGIGSIPVGPTFKACSSLGLTHLDVTFDDYPKKLSEFVDCFLNNGEMFKTLKVLWISRYGRGCADGRDDLKANPEGVNLMKKFVLTMVGMQRVGICYPIFEKENWWDPVILPCILENNIPLEFKGWPKREYGVLRCSD